MNQEDKFDDEMRDICEEYYRLIKQKKIIDEQLESLHNYLETTMRKYDREEYDNPEIPVKVDKIIYTTERMRKGGKDKLREILTARQWSQIYRIKEIVSYRVSPRDD